MHICFIISRLFLLRMRNVPDKSCRENQNKHFVFSTFPPPPENGTVCEIMWKNIVERCGSQMTMCRKRIACWITKATNKHSEYVILIACPLQQWLQESASALRYTYIVCLVIPAPGENSQRFNLYRDIKSTLLT